MLMTVMHNAMLHYIQSHNLLIYARGRETVANTSVYDSPLYV